MQSRRDQVQAHTFVMGRLTTGVLRLEPDGLDQPVSRTTRGIFGGLIVAGLIGVVITLFGFIVPGGNTSWQKAGALVMEKDSGARFLSMNGTLHPVLNLASAKLLAGSQMSVVNANAKSLREAPRGVPIGLVGAPDSLPATDDLSGDPWMACNVRSRDDTGTVTSRLALFIGSAPGGRVLGRGDAVPVAGPDGHDYLLWNGQRLRIDQTDNVIQAVGSAGSDLPEVTTSFLDVVPAGPDLTVPTTAGTGSPGPELAGRPTRLGQLFTDASRNQYLLTEQGLVALTPTLAALLKADPVTQSKAYAGGDIVPVALGPDDLAGHLAPPSATAALTHQGALPDAVPVARQVDLNQAVCQQVRPGTTQGAGTLLIVDVDRLAGGTPDNEPGVTASCLPAESIAVRPGGGALVNATLAGGGSGSAYFLVTDSGVKYPVPDNDSLEALGYGAIDPARLPTSWLNLLPTGPVLTPSAVTAGAAAVESGPPGAGCLADSTKPPSGAGPGGDAIPGRSPETNRQSAPAAMTSPVPPA
ncbi:type VII secretion protein EccB [Kineosporia mesophila]|uniref:Type VII secretion protein EccB n=1 Tax=Kineosporia mesophila TaxID=566012 RepID=A0ABP7A174_9ACTN|nr:type VII secretion protein EccB [Kineosporia mesophila]